jgi:hypothetical protein
MIGLYCCICKEEISGYGNNPDPVRHSGRCCNTCNSLLIVPARIRGEVK